MTPPIEPAEPTAAETPKAAFPYKTLIWAVVAVIAIFLFKSEIGGLLSKAEKLSLFGIDIEVGKQQAEKLSSAIAEYELDIEDFNKQVAEQQGQIEALEALKGRLQREIANCPSARPSVRQLNLEFDKIQKANIQLKKKSDAIKNTKIMTRDLSAAKIINQ